MVATRALQEDATDGKAGKPKATGLEGHDMVIENGQVVAGGTDEQDSVGGWDAEGGYILGCLCQGRFGNQFDYMLGFLEVSLDHPLYCSPVHWRGHYTGAPGDCLSSEYSLITDATPADR